MDTFVLVQGRHTLAVDENEQISRGENGGLLVYDNISGLLSELPTSPEVLSFFNLSNEIQESKDEEWVQLTDSCSVSNVSENNTNSNTNLSKLGAGMLKKQECNNIQQKSAFTVWDDKAVKLLFSLYKDYQDAFKSTSIKKDIVWDKIGNEMKTNGYNFTKTQIKDKWTNMRKHYIRVKDYNKQTGAERKTYRYYNEMDELYGNKPNVNPVAIASNMKKKIEDENTSLSPEDYTTDDQRSRKKSKVERQLSSWADKFIQHNKEREDRQEKRQAERIAAIDNATTTFRDMMEKLIDKL